MRFWDAIKELSAQGVRDEARRLFVLALAGDPIEVEKARELCLGEGGRAGDAWVANPFLYCVSPPYNEEDEKWLRHADLIVSLPGGPGLTDFRPADTLPVARAEDILQAVMAYRQDLRIALARRLPGFRRLAADHVIADVSRINAEFALLSTLTQGLPWLQPLFPAIAGADVLVLTKNQMLLVFRLAAIYDQDLSPWIRLRQTLPIVGSAVGWRTIARELAGLVPVAGLPFKAAVAFTGTYASGRAVQMVFDKGRQPTRLEMRKIYEEGALLAKGAVAALKDRIRRRKPEGSAAKALMEGQAADADLIETADETSPDIHAPSARE